MVRHLFRAALGLLLGFTASIAWADAVDTTLYFTTYNGGHNVNSVQFTYDGVSTIAPYAVHNIASTPGADGIVFAPDGDLLIGGQNSGPGGTGVVYKVNIAAHTFTGVTTNTPVTGSYHLSLDPSGLAVWSAGIPGELSRVPLNPFAAGTQHAVTGADTHLDSLAFHGGTTVYTQSGSGGGGYIGTIDMTTFVTTRLAVLMGNTIAASHGLVFDPFTNSYLLCGAHQIAQLNAALTTITTRTFTGLPSGTFDQMSTDGHGHAWVADNNGNLLFIDFAASGLFTDPTNFTNYRFLADNLDDLAPLVGPGAPAPAPAGVVLLGLGGLGLAGYSALRRRAARAKVAV